MDYILMLIDRLEKLSRLNALSDRIAERVRDAGYIPEHIILYGPELCDLRFCQDCLITKLAYYTKKGMKINISNERNSSQFCFEVSYQGPNSLKSL